MKRVLIDMASGRLCDIVAVGGEFPVHPSLQWVDAPRDATPETHYYNGAAVVVKPPKSAAEIAAEESAQAKRELAALDLASIPMLRAYIAAKPDAPQELKGLEAAAAVAKAKIK